MRAPELDQRSDALFAGATVQTRGDGDVLDGDPERLEEGDLLFRAPPRARADEDLADFPADVLVSEVTFALRDQEVASLVEGRFAPIDEQARPLHRLRVQ